MIYKTILTTIVLAFMVHNVSAQQVDFEIRYNASSCNYEAVAHVTGTLSGTGTRVATTGFTVVMPKRPTAAEDPQAIVPTSVNGGNWTDTDPTFGDGDAANTEYHKFASTSGAIPATTNDEILLFTFSLPANNCISGLRLFNNNDVNGQGGDPNPEGNTYENSFQVLQPGEVYNGNINNSAIILSRPTPTPVSNCSDTNIILNSNVSFVSCQDLTFNWSGPNAFTSSDEDPSFEVTDSEAQSGNYTVSVTDRNGCEEIRTITVDAVSCRALPVTMKSFEVMKDGEHALLDWSTSSELNNLHFEVESSQDGKNFDKIGKVLGSGTTSENTTYDFTDREPYSGVNFYRLKQVDFNGEFEYSDVRTLDFRGDNDFYVFPNPANDHIVIRTTEREFEEDTQFQLFNELGQLVKSEKLTDNKNVSVAELANGMYVLRIVGNNQNVLWNQKINILR